MRAPRREFNGGVRTAPRRILGRSTLTRFRCRWALLPLGGRADLEREVPSTLAHGLLTRCLHEGCVPTADLLPPHATDDASRARSS